jgi:hypothetical protein
MDDLQRVEASVEDRNVLCWFVFFWRAISANGLTFTHLVTMSWNGAIRQYAWELLVVRVLAMSIECARLVHKDAVIMASVMTGASLQLPGWSRRGMPIPFVFDVVFGVSVYEERTPCFELYELCLDALFQRTTLENAFAKGEAFMANILQQGFAAQDPLWFAAQEEYRHILTSPDVFDELWTHPDALHNGGLHDKMKPLCTIATKAFWRVCHAPMTDLPYNLHYSMFYV